jgi:hypothetical protein
MVNSVQEFEMRKKVQAALRSGRYFITVTYVDEQEMLQHYYICNEFPQADLVGSLSHVANEIDGVSDGQKDNS